MPIRLSGETEEDEIRDEPLSEPSDRISGEDVFGEGGIAADDDDDRQGGVFSSLPGPLIAGATFVPTFLAIFFGLSYMIGPESGPMASAPAPSAPSRTADPATSGPRLSEALRDPFVAPPPAVKPSEPSIAASPSDAREPVQAPSPVPAPPSPVPAPRVDTPSPAIESPGPTLPPAPPRTAISRAPEPRASRAPQAAVLNTTRERPPAAETRPAVEDRKGGGDWTPAAAFADRAAASRLASSIQQQGYPVEIRQEQSSTRPWVVWIGAQPRGGERRR